MDSLVEAKRAMNTQLPTLDRKQQEMIEDSARWRLISLLFESPVAGWREMLIALASAVPDADLKEAAEAAQAEASEGLYYSLFGPGGPASPREVSYRRSVELGGLMSELAGYYDAFGYSPNSGEACDHVAVEAGFVGYLRLKEAYALACQESEHAETTADAMRHFIEDHLSIIAQPLGKVLDGTGIRYLELAGRALVQNAGRHRR
jgi:nitrate reductase assembly molybdenum cofactor insertion protein NarJ